MGEGGAGRGGGGGGGGGGLTVGGLEVKMNHGFGVHEDQATHDVQNDLPTSANSQAIRQCPEDTDLTGMPDADRMILTMPSNDLQRIKFCHPGTVNSTSGCFAVVQSLIWHVCKTYSFALWASQNMSSTGTYSIK